MRRLNTLLNHFPSSFSQSYITCRALSTQKKTTTLSVDSIVFWNRPGFVIENGSIELIVLTGGGHIASIRRTDLDPKLNSIRPLWIPPWAKDGYSVDPSLRFVAMRNEKTYPQNLENVFLTGIFGHNICFDVFGAHSSNEVEKSDLLFHGEAGLVTWNVKSVEISSKEARVVMDALLPKGQYKISRTFTVETKSDTVKVDETIENLVGFERVLGRAQHVTLGDDWLKGEVEFATNADKGHTWPDKIDNQTWKPDQEFDYPYIPTKDGKEDWRQYPRAEAPKANLCTLRIKHSDEIGWFTSQQKDTGLTLGYQWSRKDFPWLMTWEEHNSRMHAPWSGRTLTRGLEFSSYALATSRRWNVEKGKILNTPTFEWLDAYEKKTTSFSFFLRKL